MKELYSLYSGYLYALCCRYVTDKETAKDILQDGFVKIFSSVGKFQDRGEGSLKAWMSIPASVIQDFIRRLPDGYRTVFNLYVFEELSHKEIAETLGIKVNSSASQYHRAKAMLARWLNDYRKERHD